jgi:hypothetical protein
MMLSYFKGKYAFFCTFVSTLSGREQDQVRSSRKCGDVDLTSEIVSITKSRYIDIDSPTKTVASERKIALGKLSAPTVAMIASIIVLHRERFTRALERLFEAKLQTLTETLCSGTDGVDEAIENENDWSGRVDLNHRLHGPEPCALPS